MSAALFAASVPGGEAPLLPWLAGFGAAVVLLGACWRWAK